MLTSAAAHSGPRRRPFWRWVLIGFGLCCFSLAVVAYNLVTLSSEATALRKELASALTQRAHTRVQVSVGPILLSAVRAGLSFIDDIPADARLAMRGVERASVGVYALDDRLSPADSTRMFTAADKLMARRGWSRVVGVKDRETVVLVYVPIEQNEKTTERVCVAVCADKNLIVVSGKLRFEPLVQLALQQHLLASR
ncbi:MAG TPA: hypothetical protein VM100_06320 [Longimicrobiales bacterium]|nr:hypothetical protein [Longimicrobiales bacterium]